MLYVGNRLSRHGITPTTIEVLGPLLERRFRVVYTSDKRNKAIRMLDMAYALLRVTRKVDVVLIDTYSTLNFWYAVLVSQLARLLRVPYVPILHGGSLPKRLKRNPWLCRQVFNHSLINVAPSGYLETAFQRSGYATTRIPNFININQYPYHERRLVGPRLLWVRSLASAYHPEMAIRVLARLTEAYPKARLCMVGPDKDGSLARCQSLAEELSVSEKARFTGRLSKADWIALSAEYDIFINTTNYDNTPVSVIEAMALGLPIVSTNAGGLPYLIDDGQDGLLVDKGDEAAMATAIRRLIEEPGLAGRLSARARAKAESFDAEIVLQQWAGLLSAKPG